MRLRDVLCAPPQVAAAVATPIALDEGVFDAEDALRHLRTGAAGGAMIKLIKSGGIQGAWRLAAVLDAAGLPFQVAGMPGEASIAGAAAAHLAVALPRLGWDCGIGVHAAAGDVVTRPLTRPVAPTARPTDRGWGWTLIPTRWPAGGSRLK
jgi:L-alanine-DL-glutamate epimerase-like enolase superfamily enzyme